MLVASNERIASNVPPSVEPFGKVRDLPPTFWEQFYGSPEVQHTLDHSITGQFVVKPALAFAGKVNAWLSDDHYDFAQLRNLNPVETRDAGIDVVIGAGAMLIPGAGQASVMMRGELVAERSVVGRVASTGEILGSTTEALSLEGEQFVLGAAQRPSLVYQPNVGGIARTREYMIDLAEKMGAYIPEDVDIQFVDPTLLGNKVGAKAEYGQLGNYLGQDPSRVMTWDSMIHDLTGKIPVRISNKLLISDESAVAHIAHESFELAKFEAKGQWTQSFYIQQTAIPEQGGLQASWHSKAWEHADQIILKLREAMK